MGEDDMHIPLVSAGVLKPVSYTHHRTKSAAPARPHSTVSTHRHSSRRTGVEGHTKHYRNHTLYTALACVLLLLYRRVCYTYAHATANVALRVVLDALQLKPGDACLVRRDGPTLLLQLRLRRLQR